MFVSCMNQTIVFDLHIYLMCENKIWIPTDMKKKSIKHENPSPSPPPIGNKIVGALTSFNVLGATYQNIDFGRYFWTNSSFLHIGHIIIILFLHHIKVCFLLLFEVMAHLTGRNLPFSNWTAFWASLHPPLCLQTTGRQDALPNCILGNHLLIKWLKDNHMISKYND